ncbi:MAG: hypothetical protein M3487_04575 [Actinomycetota bacterium]|nr:hypothetical protein [Actinomycetota bacterium]
MALIEADPAAFGEVADNLVDQLRQVEESAGRQQARRAADLVADIEEWGADGRLEPGVAALARPLLEPLAVGPGNDGDNGRGRDDGDDDEDDD